MVYEWWVFEEVYPGPELKLMEIFTNERGANLYLDTLYRECDEMGLDCSFCIEKREKMPKLFEGV